MGASFICVSSAFSQKTAKTPYKTKGKKIVVNKDSVRIFIEIFIKIFRSWEAEMRSKNLYKNFQALPAGPANTVKCA